VDPIANEYIRCQTEGRCLREFTRRALRPEPKELNLPGFNSGDTRGFEISWVVEGEELRPEAGKCCSASCCQAPGSDLNAGFLTDAEKVAAKSRHNLIREVLLPETFAAEQILGPLPEPGEDECSEEERVIFRATLEQWRDSHWQSIRGNNPMLSSDWVLGKYNLERVVDHIQLVVNTDREKIDRRWLRALITTVADDSAVDSMALVIQRFQDEFFARLEGRDSQPSRQY